MGRPSPAPLSFLAAPPPPEERPAFTTRASSGIWRMSFVYSPALFLSAAPSSSPIPGDFSSARLPGFGTLRGTGEGSRIACASCTPAAPSSVGVVDLRVPGEVPGGEALDHVEHPQRAVAVEQLRMQLRDRGLQRGHRAGLGEPDPADVPGEVHFPVLDPHGARDGEREGGDAAREHGRQVQARGDVLHRPFVEGGALPGRHLVEVQRPHVHRGLGRLQVQERRVQAGKRFHDPDGRRSETRFGDGSPEPSPKPRNQPK